MESSFIHELWIKKWIICEIHHILDNTRYRNLFIGIVVTYCDQCIHNHNHNRDHNHKLIDIEMTMCRWQNSNRFYVYLCLGTSISSLRNNGSSSETQTKQRQHHHPKARESQVHNINIHLHGNLNIYIYTNPIAHKLCGKPCVPDVSRHSVYLTGGKRFVKFRTLYNCNDVFVKFRGN